MQFTFFRFSHLRISDFFLKQISWDEQRFTVILSFEMDRLIHNSSVSPTKNFENDKCLLRQTLRAKIYFFVNLVSWVY